MISICQNILRSDCTARIIAFRQGFPLLILVFLASMRPVDAQTSDVYGIVSDAVTNQRIPFANVSVLNTTRGAAANQVGFYFISKLPPGRYEISASSIGFTKSTKTITVMPRQSVEVNFELAAIPIESQEVLVTAPRRQTELETKMPSVHVLERREIKAVPTAGQQDLLQSLKILPGIVSTSDVSSRFYVRGGAGDQNLFLFDGIRVRYPFHALGIYSVFSPEAIENVEVYTGAYPPGFGGKLSSVVNISSRDGRADRLGARAHVNFLSSEFSLEGPSLGQSSFFVNGRKSISSRTFGRISGQNIPLEFYDVTAKFAIQSSGVSKFGLTLLNSNDRLIAREPTEGDYAWKTKGFSLTGSGLPTENMFVGCVVYVSNYSATRSASVGGNVTPSSTSAEEVGVRVNATVYATPSDQYHFGFEFGFPKLASEFTNRLGVLQRIESTPLEVSGWARFTTAIGPATLDAGLHLELGYLTYGRDALREIQPRINATYQLAGTWRVKASFGRFTQRMMTVDNEDDVMSIFDAWLSIAGDKRSEQADHYVLGITGNPTERSNVNVEGYYKNYNTLFLYNRDKIDATDPDYIEGKGSAYGVEVTLRAQLPYVDLYGAYSLSWVRINNAGFVYYPRYDRRHHLNLMAIGHPLNGLTTTIKWEVGSGFPFSQTTGYFDQLGLGAALPGPFELETGLPYLMLGAKNAVRLPAYHRMDIGVSYNIRILGFQVECGVDILNVYDNKNIFYIDRKTGQRVNMLAFFPSVSLTVIR